jgi:hypothetical protein
MRWQTDRMTEYKFSRSDPCRCLQCVQTPTYRERGYQKVTPVNVVTPLVVNTVLLRARWPIHCERPVLDRYEWMTSGDPMWPTWLSTMEAVSVAVVDFVGNSSTHLEKASMIIEYTHYYLHLWSVVQLQMDYMKHKWIDGLWSGVPYD